MACLKTNHDEDARDIASETFCRAFLKLGQHEFRRSESLHPWLYRIALNLIADRGRARSLSGMISLDSAVVEGACLLGEQLVDTNPGPEEMVEQKITQISFKKSKQ